MDAVRTMLANLPLIMCLALAVSAPAVLLYMIRRSRTRREDTTAWAPARGTVVERREHSRGGRLNLSLTVAFSTFDGRQIEFTDELAAWQVEYGPTVPVIYDPADPERARVVRRRRSKSA